jgi:RNA polymerase sigma-70 factor (ECF subfamily)
MGTHKSAKRGLLNDTTRDHNFSSSTIVALVHDEELLARFLDGDRSAFRAIMQRYHALVVRVARHYVNSDASAQDVAQDTWIAVLRGAERFEGRSTFKTWLLRITVNLAKKTGTREHRVVNVDPVDPVSRTRFDSVGMWNEAPQPFTELVEGRLARADVVDAVHRAIRELPELQQAVVTLRDVEGLSTSDVAELLELSDANVRVLLHRGRARIREVLEMTMNRGQPWH